MPTGVYIRTEEHRRKISEAMKGKRAGENNPFYGMTHSEETRRKLSDVMKGNKNCVGRKISEETRQKILEALNDPDYKRKQSEAHRGNKYSLGAIRSEETRRKIGAAKNGENNPHWRGGISFEPYCPKFNNEFKERVRSFFGHRCAECGEPQNGYKLHVHHVNFNKMSCCDGTPPLFVPLCTSCHSKTNHNREYWEQHFTRMINEYHGGMCYFAKEEAAA